MEEGKCDQEVTYLEKLPQTMTKISVPIIETQGKTEIATAGLVRGDTFIRSEKRESPSRKGSHLWEHGG